MEQRAQLVQEEHALPEGMLFVRITYILSTMVNAPVVAVCFFLVAISSFAQYSFSSSSTKVLDFTIYADGTTHVFYQINVDEQSPDATVDLFGNTTDNFVAQDENGTLLSSKINTNSVTIQTLGASLVKIDYDTADLVTKSGKTWTFHVDSPTDFSLALPKNTVIVGMSTYPLNMQIVDNQSLITLPSGSADISYVFGVLGTNQTATLAIAKAQDFINNINSEGIKTPLAAAKLADANSAFSQGKYSNAEVLANDAKNTASQEQQTALSNSKPIPSDNTPILIGGGIAGAVAISVVLIKRTKNSKPVKTSELSKNDNFVVPDKETIFRLKPELRQEDKDIVTFISENGGQAYESELRKKFLLPRTTTWRAVKRLEREGIVEIEKVDQQNLIKLRKMQGENQE
ncbi:MAG TPA: MarR family transcriptional regulator [Nitrosopumilaceae archaeon]|nr:MarR family transcriptional regulator [Nitrosopumilaceae archaeon]